MNDGALKLDYLNDLPDYMEPVAGSDTPTTPNDGALKINFTEDTGNIPDAPFQEKDPLRRRDDEGLKDLESFAVRDNGVSEAKTRLAKNKALSGMAAAWKGDDNDRLMMGRRLASSLFGIEYANEPALYWMSQKKPMPRFQDKSEAYRAMWDDFETTSKTRWKKVREEQKVREQFGNDLNDFVGKVSRGELTDMPTPEQSEALKKGGVSWESLIRAGKATRALKEYDSRMSGYYDMEFMGKLRDLLEDDKKAKNVFMNNLFNEHKNHYREVLKNPMNMDSDLAKSSAEFFSPVVLGADNMLRNMDKFANRAWRGVSTMGGTENRKSFSFGKDANNATTLNYESKPIDKELERFNAEYISVLESAEDEVSSKDRSVLEQTGATLGSILGDSLPMFIPLVGRAGLAASSIQGRQEEGFASGLDYDEARLRGYIFGATDTAEELLAFGKLGKLATSVPFINKMVRGSKALDKLAPWRSRYLKSEVAQLGVSAVTGTLEEGLLEPTAGALMKSLGNFALNDERGKYKLQDYVNEVSQLGDPVFLTSLLLFSGGMSMTAFPQIREETKAFTASRDHYKALGGTDAGFHNAQKIKDAEKRFDFIQSDIREAWKADPDSAMERSREAMGGIASAEETRALRQMEGFAAMQEMGLLPKFEKSEEDGKYRVYDPMLRRGVSTEETGKVNEKGEEKPSYTLMSEEALDQYLRTYMNESTRSMILGVQNLMVGDVTVESLKKDGFLIEEMAGTETYETLRALTSHAESAIRALESSGMTREEAMRQIDPSVSENLALGDVLSIYQGAKERRDTAMRRGEADSFASNAYVVQSFDKRGGMKKVLRYARGLAGVSDLWEETMEQAALLYCRENGMDVRGFGKLLQDAQRVINAEYGGKEEDSFIDLSIENPTYQDCVEALSSLGKSKMLAGVRENSKLPEWVRKLVDFLVQFMGQFRSTIALGENLKKMEADGKLTLPIRQMLGRMTGAVEDIYAEQAELDVSRFVDSYLARAKIQAEMDVRLGAGVANESGTVEEALNDLNSEQEEQSDREKVLDDRERDRLRREHEESGRNLSDEEIEQASEQAARDREDATIGVMGEEDVLGVFNGGRCVAVSDGVYQGFIDLSKLTLCKDVPQFKQGADPTTGVKNRIVGAWRRDSAPVSVWMRKNGKLEVISGRHRFAACSDVDICCQVYIESSEHDLAWAKRHDVENNIRDGQAGMFEIARYVRDGNLSMDEATERGIARAGASLKGVEVGLLSDRSLMSALENGEINEDDAYRVAKSFPNNEVQRLGVNVLRDGGSWSEAYNTMQAKVVMDMLVQENEAAGVQMGIDLFGNTDMEELSLLMGKYATRRYSDLGKEMTAISGASKNPKLAKKYGIDVNDPESARKAVAALQEQRNKWKNFALHSDLLHEANEFAKGELGIDSQKTVVNFSLASEMAAWKNVLDNYLINGATNRKADMRVCTTPAVLRALGGKSYDLVLTPDVVDKVMSKKHSVSRDAMEQLPKAISEPLAVFESTTAPNSLVVLTDLMEGVNNIVVAVQLEELSGRVSVNRIRSLYGKDNARSLLNAPLRYFDIKKARPWLTANGLQLPYAVPSKDRRKQKILRPDDVVNWKLNNNVTFSIIGENAATFVEYNNNGLTYLDPADGMKKAILDSRGVKLKREVFSVPAGGVTKATLGAVLDYEELYRAYPDLRKYTVHFYNDPQIQASGFCDAKSHYMAVNVAYGQDETLDTILHEVQHVIQANEGFSRGAGSMDKDTAVSYIQRSLNQLRERSDEWAVEAVPRLESLSDSIESGETNPMSVYYASHGEKEARLSGSFGKGSIGPSMAGLNGAGMLDVETSIPLTGDITELGGITFDKGRFGKMATGILAPPGDWVIDQLIFRIRASLERAAKRFAGYSKDDDGMALFAEASELIASAEKFLPGNYGFALEPYKIWLNVFSRLHGSGNIGNAINGIPMSKWPEIMKGSFLKQLAMAVEHGSVRNADIWESLGLSDIVDNLHQAYGEGFNELFAEGLEKFEGESNANANAKAYAMEGIIKDLTENGMLKEFMQALGEVKVHRLAERFMNRVVEQIDKFRKDRMLGRIRRVTSSVTPMKKPGEKPVRGKMDSDAYRKLEKYIQLMEMTESQYESFFAANFPDNAEEGKRYEDVPPDGLLEIVMTDEEGKKSTVTCEKQEFDAYACYNMMKVEAAEKCAAALGEFVSTSRNAWENAAAKHRAKIEGHVSALLKKTGIVSDADRAVRRRKEKLQSLPNEKLSLMDVFMNFGQYMDTLGKYPELKEWALSMKARAAMASIRIETSEKNRLADVDDVIETITGLTGKYEKSDWIYEYKRTREVKITLTEEEPDWDGKARKEYRERLLKLLSRKARVHGLESLKPYLSHFKLSDALRAEVEMKYHRPGKALSEKEIQKANEHMNRVFTAREWDMYMSMEKFVKDNAARLRKNSDWGKEKDPKEAQSSVISSLSRDVAANIILLSEQEDYTDMLRRKGYNASVIEQLREFVGEEGMEFAYRLRDLLGKRSKLIQSVVENRYGAPFPLVENYFRAYFDVDMEMQNKSIADGSSYGDAASGGKYGLIHSRRKHNAALDLEMGASAAFMAASMEQDVFLHCSEISRDMRAFINYKDGSLSAGRSLGQLVGSDAVSKLSVWVDALDKTGVEHIRGHVEMNKLFSRLSGAAARVLLSWRMPTLAKQFTALTNGMYGSDDVTARDGIASMGRVIGGTAIKSVADMLALDEIGSRDKTAYSVTRDALAAPGDKVISRWDAFARKGMDNIESLDVLCNAISSAVVYDAVYRRLQREMPDGGAVEWDAGAMQSVREALEVKSQPMNHRMRSLVAQNKLWLLLGPLYLAGESVNAMARIISLARRGHWGKASALYLTNGAVLAVLQAVINFLTDDEEKRKKRSVPGYLLSILAGPLSGIPLISGTMGYAIQETARLIGAKDVYVPRENTLVPFADVEESWRAVKKAWDSIGDSEAPWQNRVLAWTGLVRSTAVMLGTFMPQDKKWKAATTGAAYSTAAGTNLLDFLLKVERNVEDNGLSSDKWMASTAKAEAKKRREKQERAKERKEKKKN